MIDPVIPKSNWIKENRNKNALLEIISSHCEFHLFSRCRLRCQLGTCPDTFEFWRRIENSSTIKWKLYDTIGVKPFWRHIIWVQLLFWAEFYSHYWRILRSFVRFSDLKNSDDSWFRDKVQTGKVEIKDTDVSYYIWHFSHRNSCLLSRQHQNCIFLQYEFFKTLKEEYFKRIVQSICFWSW